MKKLLYILSSILPGFAFAQQQMPTFNHYTVNPYLINPALTGDSTTNVYLIHRQQWMGMTGAPVSQALTIDGAIKPNKIGLGLNLQNDVTNVLGRTSGMGSYAYTIKINNNNSVKLGIAAGMLQQRIMFNKVKVDNTNDNTLLSNADNRTSFDANFGLAYRWKKLTVAVAANQLLANSILFENESEQKSTYWKNVRNYSAYVSYPLLVKKDVLSITPIFVVRTTEGLPIQADVNAVFTIKNNFWINAGYRQNSGLMFMAGATIFNQVKVGYAYEYPTTSLKTFTTGSHEVLIGYSFGKKVIKEIVEERIINDNTSANNIPATETPEYKALQEKVDRLSEDIAAMQRELENSKNEMKKHLEVEAVNEVSEKEYEKIKKEGEEKTKNSTDKDKIENYYVVIGVYKTLPATKKFQKLVKQSFNLDTKVVMNNAKTHYFVYTQSYKSKNAAYKEADELNKLHKADVISGHIWVNGQ